ncbi:hypothetical protein KC19_12G022300 [Ceratodon purpureus]|uniref:Uncharacterized protein n=1 Tax=Ceratodon purpureus TaxID=3225 RepID=A0A8T0G6S2_CERPU|nr:hypothetical protein KC19_12G022300 [Ceratodon purpureus]
MDSSARSTGLGSQSAGPACSIAAPPQLNGAGDAVVINVSDPVPSKRTVTNEIEANCLEEIEKIPRLRLILADWENKYKESRQRIDRKETLSLNVKNEIYNLIGFFSVFQGVVLTTVSQASALTCHNWWAPFTLSLLCSIATVFGVCHKFYNFFEWKRATVDELEHSKVLRRQIHSLKKQGKKFDFSQHAPDQDNKKELERKKKINSWRRLIFNRYFILAFLVVLSMLGFSAIILISCYRILCDH